MKLNFTTALLEITGEPQNEGLKLNTILAGYLANSNSKTDAIKFYEWGKKLYKGEELDLDKQDQKLLTDFISNHDGIITLVRAQLLEVFDKKEN